MAPALDSDLLSLGGLAALVGLAVFLLLPSGLEAWFGGPPWSGRAELWVVAGAVPLLLVIDRTYLNQRLPYLVMALLLVLRLLMSLMAPGAGWEVRVYATPQAMQEGRWERTWATIWRPGLSGLLDRPWTARGDFPAAVAAGAWLGLEFQGAARLPEGAGLAVAAAGLESGSVLAFDTEGGGARPVPLVKDPAQAAGLAPEDLARGGLRLEGRLRFGPGEWSLAPVLVGPGGKIEPAFGRGALWRGAAGLTLSDLRLRTWLFLARAMDLAFAVWLAAWALWGLRARLLRRRARRGRPQGWRGGGVPG